jgi:hypothetical protein
MQKAVLPHEYKKQKNITKHDRVLKQVQSKQVCHLTGTQTQGMIVPIVNVGETPFT